MLAYNDFLGLTKDISVFYYFATNPSENVIHILSFQVFAKPNKLVVVLYLQTVKTFIFIRYFYAITD